MPSVAAVSLGGAVLFAAASSAKSPTSASSPVTLAGNSLLCSSSCVLRSLSLRRARRRGGRRFEIVRAEKDDEAKKNGSESNNSGEKGPVDWDKAWSSYKKPQKKRSFLKIDMEQYVSRRPTHSDYPLSEEVDPLRKSERSALGAWTSLNFTFSMVFVIIGLAVYMVIIVGPPPHH